MKKVFTFFMIIMLSIGTALAASPRVDSTVKIAIKKYKDGNYTGCMQDLKEYTKTKHTALSHYYLAMAYTKTGMNDEARENYEKAIDLANTEKNEMLKRYAKLGKKELENPSYQDNYDEINMVIQDKNAIPEDLKNDLKKKHLEYLRNEINSGQTPNF